MSIAPVPSGIGVVQCVEIGEAVACLVITHASVRIAHLEHVEPVEMFLNPGFLTDVPGHRVSGEETEAVTIGKVLRTVVAEIIVEELTVGKIVSDLSCQTHILA